MRHKIGIIGAMELETEHLREEMNVIKTREVASRTFYEGTLNGTDIVLVQCGVGKVNAGICVQILVDLFGVTEVINTGIAGSLEAKIDIGDIVVSSGAVYHDFNVGVFGYKLGQVPGIDVWEFPADPILANMAIEACKSVNPDIHVYSGRVVSGDQFIGEKSAKEYIKENFEPYCTEMEGCAIAHVAYLNKLPFVIIRAISDKADDSADMDYPEFERAAAIHSARIVEELIKTIGGK